MARGCSRLQEAVIPSAALELLDLTNCSALHSVSLLPSAAAAGAAHTAHGPGAAAAPSGQAQGRPKLKVVLEGCPRLNDGFYRQIDALRERR